MSVSIFNGLERTTKEINMNFRIKVNGIVDGKKINTLVGVSGLIKLVGIEMANKMKRRDDDEKGIHGVPNGYISCEGRCCQEAYEMYIEEWTE